MTPVNSGIDGKLPSFKESSGDTVIKFGSDLKDAIAQCDNECVKLKGISLNSLNSW